MSEVKAGDVLKLDKEDMVEDKRQCSWKQFWISKAGGASLIIAHVHIHL